MANLTNINNKFLVTTGGDVGIGTTSPSEKLSVNGNISLNRYLSLSNSDYTYILGKRTSPSDGFYLTRLMGYGDNTFYGSFDVLRHDADDGELRFRTRTAGAITDVMTIVDKNVGIGTTTPDRKLHVNSGSTNEVAKFESTDSTAYLSIVDNSTTYSLQGIGSVGNNLTFYSNNAERMRIDNSGFVTIKNNAGVSNASLTFSNSDLGIGIDQSIGYLNFYSNDNSTTSTGGVGGVAVKSEEAFNTSYTPTYMSFYTHERTANDGTSLGNVTERMRISSRGDTTHIASYAGGTFPFRVGYGSYSSFTPTFVIDDNGDVAIGATSSSSRLKVVGPNTSSNPLVDLVASGTGSFQRGVRLLNGGMNSGDELMYAVGRSDNTRNMGQMYFHYVGNGSTSNRISMGLHGVDDVFNIAGTGNIGIGTTSPANKFVIKQGSNVDMEFGSEASSCFIQTYNRTSSAWGNLRFITSGAETMRLTTSGNVGIGTTAPLAKFQVLGVGLQGMHAWFGTGFVDNAAYHYSFAKVGFSTNVSNGTETGAGFQFNTRNSSNTNWMHGYIYQPQNGGISFGTGGAGTGSATTKMFINSAGYVAIGGTLGADSQFRVELKPAGTILAGLRIGYNSTSNNYFDGDNQYFRDGAGTTNRMVIDSGGSINQNYISGLAGTSDYGFTIAKQTGYSQIYFRADTTSTRYIQRFYNDNSGTLQNVGNIIISGSTTSYTTSSDYRLKENVVELTGALDRVSQLKPSRFNFIADADTTVDGFLAHEVQEIVPEAISGEKDGIDEEGNPEYQGIDQSKLVPLLVGAIQELKAEIDELKK